MSTPLVDGDDGLYRDFATTQLLTASPDDGAGTQRRTLVSPAPEQAVS